MVAQRKELDALAAHNGLAADAVERLLERSGARPSPTERARFAQRLLMLAGVLSLAAGVVFFVAANWSALGVFVRFALAQGLIVAAVAAALWRPPPHRVGRYALLLAFIATGALLALLGQTYQTGADVYELFLTWTLLGAVFTLAAQWSVAWAAWALVLNVALLLFSGWQPQTGLLWLALGVFALEQSAALLLPAVVNLLLWQAGRSAAASTRFAPLAPPWLLRFVLACAVAFGTWAGIAAVIELDSASADAGTSTTVLLIVIALFAALAYDTLRRRADVFPLALVSAGAIAVSTFAIGVFTNLDELVMVFTLAVWLIASSTLSGHLLMKVLRAWRDEATT